MPKNPNEIPESIKLVAYLPGGEVIEFIGADVAMYGHNPETGHPIFVIKPREEDDPDAETVERADYMPDVVDVYHAIPFMIRQKKSISRVHVPNPPGIIKA